MSVGRKTIGMTNRGTPEAAAGLDVARDPTCSLEGRAVSAPRGEAIARARADLDCVSYGR